MMERLRYVLGGGLGALGVSALMLGCVELAVWIGGGLR